MSEIKLNLLDSHHTVVGTVHGSTGDRLVAALSAEPETLEELEAAFKRFEKDGTIFGIPSCRSERCEIDDRPWDAGILVIDLAARIVACESTYSLPGRGGIVDYHDGHHSTGFGLLYRLSDEWLILHSIEEYEARCKHQLKKRAAETPLDTRAILYGEPLLDFILRNVQLLNVAYASDVSPNSQPQECEPNVRYALESANAQPPEDTAIVPSALTCRGVSDNQLPSDADESRQNLLYETLVDIHRRWLMTPRDDLNGQSPREVLFAKRELIDSDLDSRMNQWSYFLEEPPCLSRDSHAYRFAGFGTHEWVMYYDLVRFLIWEAVELNSGRLLAQNVSSSGSLSITPSLEPRETTPSETVLTVCNEEHTSLVALLEELKNIWLSEPRDGYIPAEVIDNERRRRPEAMTGRSMVIDEDCPCCKMSGDLSEAGLEITFCHFDGCNMEDEFAFSWCATLEQWEQELRQREQWDRERELKDKERKKANSTDELPDEFDTPF